MSDPVRLALVGCGWIAESHITAYADLMQRGCREFLVTACCDVAREKAARSADAIAAFQGRRPEVFVQPEQLAAARVADAADICVPHCFHHSVAVSLLEAGLHVMVEKPMGITIRAGQRILGAAERHRRILATAENIRRTPGSRAAAWAVHSGLIGKPLSGHAHVITRGLTDYDDPKFKWRGVKLLTGGGMLIDTGVHFTDMMLHLFGEPDDVFCIMRTHDQRIIRGAPLVGDTHADVEDEFFAAVRFHSGMLLTFAWSRVCPGEGRRFGSYYGTHGVLEDKGFPFKPFDRAGELIQANGAKMSLQELQDAHRKALSEEEHSRLFPLGATDGFSVEVWDFVNAITAGRRPDIDGWDGQKAKALSIACYESATLGQPIKYADILNGRVRTYQTPIDEFWKL